MVAFPAPNSLPTRISRLPARRLMGIAEAAGSFHDRIQIHRSRSRSLANVILLWSGEAIDATPGPEGFCEGLIHHRLDYFGAV